MKARTILMSVLVCSLVLTLLVPATVGLGLAPSEMRVVDPYKSGVAGTIVLVNSDSGPRWIRLQIQIPSTRVSEKEHLRVICEDCHDTHQRYEVIPGYVPKEIDGDLSGICPRCGSSRLTFFELPPESLLKNITLRGKDCTLIEEGNGIYKISEKLDYREEKRIEIIFDIPKKSEYSDKHYEIHIMTTSHTDESSGFGIIPGIIMRLLIDTPEITTKSINIYIMAIGIITTMGASIVTVVIVKKRSEKSIKKI